MSQAVDSTGRVKSICVFTGSSPGARPAYAEAARALGRTLAERRLTLVYGGGKVGLMGVLADAALDAGGEAIGVIPRSLMEREVGHGGVTKLHVVESMHERKALMAELSDAVIALPGGLGTLEELFEMLTWAQLGLHERPCGLLDVDGYYSHLLTFLDHAVRERFLAAAHRELLIADDSAEALLARMARYRPPRVAKWLDRDSS